MEESTALPCCAPLRSTKNSNMRLNDVAHREASMKHTARVLVVLLAVVGDQALCAANEFVLDISTHRVRENTDE